MDKDNVCSVCHVSNQKTKLCSRCKQARYCSTECQKNDWTTHKLNCKAPEQQIQLHQPPKNTIAVASKNKAIQCLKTFLVNVQLSSNFLRKLEGLCKESLIEGSKLGEALQLYFGWGVDPNHVQASIILKGEIDNDKNGEKEETAWCHLLLTKIYESGTNIQTDPKKAAEHALKASEINNNTTALFVLGQLYRSVEEISDHKKALFYFDKGSALDDGACCYMSATCRIIDNFGNGTAYLVVTPEVKKGLEYLKRSAELKYPRGLSHLANCYLFTNYNLPQDFKKATELLTLATQFDYADAFGPLGNIYYSVDKNYEKAFHFYKRGAELGNSECIVGAASCYMYGRGVKKDFKRYLKMIEDAASMGIAKAHYYLGRTYEDGEPGFVKKDLKKALKCYQTAVDLGEQLAVNYLFSLKNRLKMK